VTGSLTGPSTSADDGSLQLTFPVLGPVRYSDGWGNPRGEHGERRHEGTDLLGAAGQPLRAAFDGVVSRYQLEDRGISGAVISITRDDGLRANYFHLNTADLLTGRRNTAPASWRIPTAVKLGSRVTAGQIIGFMGDSGNATGVPHLHFELRTPDGIAFNPYPALAAAEARERCAVVFGPWANVGAVGDVPVLPVVEVDGPGGAVWQLTARGDVIATTSAAATVGDSCDRPRLDP
jgi:murein DD-endopeptidase MepM/ murein hydrolase activator NlpD